MGINRGGMIYKAKVYAAVFIIFTSLILDSMLVYQLETEKRNQAVFNVQHTISCMRRIEQFMGELDYQGMKTCANDMRTSITGDMFILDFETREFLYDGSADIPTGQKLYFTKDSIGKYFTDWESAENAIAQIGSGIDSISTSRVKYNYDGDEEWLEYKTFQLNNSDRKIIVVQGVQSDEALSGYSFVRAITQVLVGIYAMWLLSTGITNRRRNDGT